MGLYSSFISFDDFDCYCRSYAYIEGYCEWRSSVSRKDNRSILISAVCDTFHRTW